MRVVIRADASVAIGTGHVMRCLAIAEALRGNGAEVVFASREQDGDLRDLIEAQGYPVHRLPRVEQSVPDWRMDAEQCSAAMGGIASPIDWLIVDHYGLDRRWEAAARAWSARILVIDDLADREHDCDVLLDQNYCAEMNGRYRALVPAQCRLLLGPDFALLRPEFLLARAGLRRRDGALQRMLVFFGGSDPTNETAKALQGIRQIKRPDLAVDVVVGSSNPHREEIKRICSEMPNAVYHCQVSNMAQLMVHADLAVGAGGSSTWERCCLGLPSLVAVLADNQAALTQAVAEFGASNSLGWFETLSPESYRQAIEASTVEQRQTMAQRCSELVDGKGAGRVAAILNQIERQE